MTTIQLDSQRNSATDLDGPPVYDAIAQNGIISPVWQTWFATLIDTLTAYLSVYGIFIPQLTTTDRATIQAPQVGQLIYNTVTDSLQVYRSTGWENINTTP